MGKGFLGCLTVLLAGAGLAYGQATDETLPPPRTFPSSGASAVPAAEAAKSPVPTPGADGLYHGIGIPEDGGAGAGGDRFWFGAEYLLWWFKRPEFPPLVTTGTFESQGVLGVPGTTILFGGPVSDSNRARSGFRFNAGMWLDCERTCGLEADFFYFPEFSNDKVFGPASGQLLARPFISLNTMMESAEITSLMGLAKGSTTVSTPNKFYSPEINMIHKLCCGCNYSLAYILGFRYLELDDAVDITEDIRVNPDASQFPPGFQQFAQFAGAHIVVNDHFATRNQFYGGQAGLDYGCAKGRWEFEVRGKLGLGDNHETIDINGSQVVTFANGMTQTFRGGLLALPSNIGHYTRNRFAVVPEVNVNVGYRVTNCLCVYMGYSFLYWSRVARAGDQIDRVVDVSQIPNFGQGIPPTGFARPAVPFKETDFWAQGLNFGIEITW